MNFNEAGEQLLKGFMVRRTGWSLPMFIFMQIGNTVPKDVIPNFKSLPESVKNFLSTKGEDVVFESSVTVHGTDGKMHPGWAPSQDDLNATDWDVVSTSQLIPSGNVKEQGVENKINGEAMQTSEKTKAPVVKMDQAKEEGTDKVHTSVNDNGNGNGNTGTEENKAGEKIPADDEPIKDAGTSNTVGTTSTEENKEVKNPGLEAGKKVDEPGKVADDIDKETVSENNSGTPPKEDSDLKNG